jgi:hypothetical protein
MHQISIVGIRHGVALTWLMKGNIHSKEKDIIALKLTSTAIWILGEVPTI